MNGFKQFHARGGVGVFLAMRGCKSKERLLCFLVALPYSLVFGKNISIFSEVNSKLINLWCYSQKTPIANAHSSLNAVAVNCFSNFRFITAFLSNLDAPALSFSTHSQQLHYI